MSRKTLRIRVRSRLLAIVLVSGLTQGAAFALNLSRQAQLVVPDLQDVDRFGASVAVDGDTVIVGAPGVDIGGSQTTGAAYVFVRQGTTWSQQARLTAIESQPGDLFGISVALQGNIAVVGALSAGGKGSAYVFERLGQTWNEQAVLSTSDVDAAAAFGWSVALDHNTILVGAFLQGAKGTTYVYSRFINTWLRSSTLTPDDASDNSRFGYSVSLSGDTALIGAPYDAGPGGSSGSAYVFTREGGVWSKRTKLSGEPDPLNQLFGSRVALQGATALISTQAQNVEYVFTGAGASWTQDTKLAVPGSQQLGGAVALDGNAAVVSSFDGPSGDLSGSAHLFLRTGTSWSKLTTIAPADGAPNELFGSQIAISNRTIVIGSLHHGEHGAVYVYFDSAPTVATIDPHTTPEDTPLTLALQVSDLEDPTTLTLSAASTNPALVPTSNVHFSGAPPSPNVSIAPVADLSGATDITITASDGWATGSATFHLDVTPVNDAPRISPIADQTTTEGTPTAPFTFTISDVDTPSSGLFITFDSSNSFLAPGEGFSFTGSNGSFTAVIAPRAGATGTSTITIGVTDGQASATRTFVLTVQPRSTPPPTTLTYYLAEGSTGAFFDTDLLLANPNAVAAPLTISFFKENGSTIVLSRTLAPMSRTTIQVDDIPDMEATSFSTAVESTSGLPVLVERTMWWDKTHYGAHGEKAVDGAAPQWYFAEGSQGFFSTYFLLVNPQTTANVAHVTYFREGSGLLTRDYNLPAASRVTIDAGADPELVNTSFGARVVFDKPGAAERAMYFGRAPLFTGGHDAAGATAPSTTWFLAEGATGSYFNTFVLLANPNDTDATATVTYFPSTGTAIARQHVVPGGQRVTINIADEDAALASAAVSTRVESTLPLLVERSQYWPQPEWYESHNSFGVTSLGTHWGLAEGRVGGKASYQTYILLANPGVDAATVTVRFLRTSGPPLVKTFTVQPTSRFNVAITGPGSDAPELVDEEFGAVIESSQPIAVERALYADANGITWAAGTNATASRLP